MRREWSPEDVVACWTPVGSDWDLVANKSGPTRLGFVLMLKYFELEGRFPQFLEEFPPAAVDYVADVIKVPAEDLAKYDLSSRSAKGHRTQIREALGFRPATRADEERLTGRPSGQSRGVRHKAGRVRAMIASPGRPRRAATCRSQDEWSRPWPSRSPASSTSSFPTRHPSRCPTRSRR
ncbi:DUF4158 domain-containing protein [Streptomyces virginiae]|uniref:DUF4158 domain-containing protein n=1 Tax=Streptomyces virginiae TaxID=1961 RepID=UPI0036E91E15